MRRFSLLTCLILSLLIVVAASPATVVASPAMPFAGPSPAHTVPDLTARSSIAVDLTSGLQLHSYEADVRVAPASTMKIVTALVALELLDPAEMITIIEDDLYLGEDYSQMGLMAGDVVSVEILMYGAMLSSGADASLALARVAGQRLDPETSDPVGRFVQEMNAWAAEHKMFNTSFTNPVGEDHPEHFTTARDLVRATEQMLQHWLLARVAATYEVVVTVGGPNAREIYVFSTNQLMLEGQSTGGKTGTTENAGECLVNVVTRGDHTIVTVVLGSMDRYGDTLRLLEDIDQRFRFVVLGADGHFPGISDELAAQGLQFPIRHTVLMSPEQAQSLDYVLELSGDRSQTGKVGTVVFSLGDQEVARLPVYRSS